MLQLFPYFLSLIYVSYTTHQADIMMIIIINRVYVLLHDAHDDDDILV